MNSRVQDVVFLIHGTFSHRDEDHFEPDEKNPGETAAWWQKNSDFVAEMDRLLDGKACCWPEDICQAMPWAKRSFWHGVEEWTIRGWKPFRWIRPKYRILNRQLFVWSGLNSETERRRAGGRLLEGLLSLERDNEAKLKAGEAPRFYHLIGHSHGGSVIWNALRFASRQGESLPHLKSWSTLGTPFPTYGPVRYLWLRGLIGLMVIVVFGWLALSNGDLRISGLSRTTLEALLSFSSPVNLFPFGVSLGTAGLLATLLVLAGWFLFAIMIWLYRWFDHRADSRYSDMAWRIFGGRWLGLFSTIDEAIAGSQNTVGFYVSDLVRLPWPGPPPAPRVPNLYDRIPFLIACVIFWLPGSKMLALGFVVSWFLRGYLYWLGSWFTVALANGVVLPLSEYVVSSIFRLKFQGADRPGSYLTSISPVPDSRESFPSEATLGPLPPSLENPLRELAEREIGAKIVGGRTRFADDARGPNPPNKLLNDYSKSLNVNNELIHNSYYNLDAIRSVLAYRILNTQGNADSIDSLVRDPDTRAWVEGRAQSVPARNYLPRPKPASNTPKPTQVILATMFWLVCGLGFFGLRADIYTVYIDKLLKSITAKEEKEEWRRPDLLRQSFVVFQNRQEANLIDRMLPGGDKPPSTGAEARLIEWIGQRDNQTRLNGIAFLQRFATSINDHSIDQKKSNLIHLHGVSIGSLIQVAFEGTTNQKVRIETLNLLLALPDSDQVGKHLSDLLRQDRITTSQIPDSDNARFALSPVVAELLCQLRTKGRKELVQVVLQTKDKLLRARMAEYLNRIPESELLDTVQELVKRLKDEDLSVRHGAAVALTLIRRRVVSKELISSLVLLLGDEKNYESRVVGAYGLGELGPEAADAAVGPLIALLCDQNPIVFDAAVDALGKFGKAAGPRAVKELAALVKPKSTIPLRAYTPMNLNVSEDKPLSREAWLPRIDVLAALNNMGSAGSPELDLPLLRILMTEVEYPDNGETTVFFPWITDALGKIDPALAPEAVARLIELLSDKSGPNVRSSAAKALGQFGSRFASRSVEPLIRLLDDCDAEVRGSAAEALGRMGPNLGDVIDKLIARLCDENENLLVRTSTAKALGGIGQEAGLKAVRKLLEVRAKTPGWRAVSGQMCSEAKSYAIKELAGQLSNDDPSIQIWAAEALNEFGFVASPHETKRLREQLRWQNPYHRIRVAIALSRIDPVASNPMALLLREKDKDVRREVVLSLDERRPLGRESVDSLIKILEGNEWDARAAAARALGWIGHDAGEAFEKLAEHLGDRNSEARSAAAEALAPVDTMKAVKKLTQILYFSDDEDAKATAVSALETIGPKAADAVPHLIARAISGDTKAREEALKALESINRGTGH